MKSIRECSTNTYLRRVEYVDTSADLDEIKSDLIEKGILSIFDCYQKETTAEKIHIEIGKMYSLCDAFIKDISYKPEEEVRLVIRLPQKEYFLTRHGQLPRLLVDNHFVFAEDGTYLQLPVSDEFITL